MLVQRNRRPAFSLLELAIVILLAVIGLGLLVVVLRGLTTVHTQSADGHMRNNLKQLALAMHSCNDSYKRLPPAFDKFGPSTTPFSIHVHLLPFAEQGPLYNFILRDGKTIEAEVPLYRAPGDPTMSGNSTGVQNFAANLRVFSDKGLATPFNAAMPALAAIEPGRAGLGNAFPDGTETIVFATKYSSCGKGGSRYAADPTSPFAAFFGNVPAQRPAHRSDATATFQLAPTAADCRVSPLLTQSFDNRGLLVVTASTMVRRVSPTISAETWNRLLQPNDGRGVGEDWHD